MSNEREIAEQMVDGSEVTYGIGDRFVQYGDRKFILTGWSSNVSLSELGSGLNYSHNKQVKDQYRITEKEMSTIRHDGIIRYFDNRTKLFTDGREQ